MNPGPNIDRIFYACPVSRDTGCQFFKWEAKVIEVKGGEVNKSGKRPVPKLSIDEANSLKRKEQPMKTNELRFQSIKKRKDLAETCSELFNL